MRFLCVLFLSVAVAAMAAAAPEGRLGVIDADTFDVGGVRVRLHGIDAPEIGQPCQMAGQTQDCGRWARDAVSARFEGVYVRCSQVDVDRYGRIVATCAAGSEDMGAAIVSAGWAWAYRRYSQAYDLDEKAAAVAGRGLWAFEVQQPAAYRASRVRGGAAPDPACNIKGNISSNGRIYHLPGGRGYDRTGINTENGERWFCSITQAEAAGWRAARR